MTQANQNGNHDEQQNEVLEVVGTLDEVIKALSETPTADAPEAKPEPVLTDVKVEEIFTKCLFIPGSDATEEYTEVAGVVHKVAFHRGHLEENREAIVTLLLELPEKFMASSEGKGSSFLAACVDKHDRQWTGQHFMMEKLFMLGLAIEKVKLLIPRKYWELAPGSMPYYAVLDQ